MMELKAIGVVRSGAKERKDVPPLGAPATVEVYPEYADGLLKLEKHSHLWVICWLDSATRDVLQVVPRGVEKGSEESLHGVFAVRSPSRPNPLGLTLARIVEKRGNHILLDRLDFMDGTPVVDLKPYFVARDMVFSARNEQIGRPASVEAMRESLLQQAINYHGERCADLELAVSICCDFRTKVMQYEEPPEWKVRVPARRGHLVDSVIGMTRASQGKGTLELHSGSSIDFYHQERWWRYKLKAGGFLLQE